MRVCALVTSNEARFSAILKHLIEPESTGALKRILDGTCERSNEVQEQYRVFVVGLILKLYVQDFI